MKVKVAQLLAGVVSLTLGMICLYFVTTSSSSSILIPLNKYISRDRYSTYLQGNDTVRVTQLWKLDSTVDTFQPTQLPKLDNSSSDFWFSTYLLIMVPTRPSNTVSRQLVRDTWFKGFQNNKDVALRFVIGSRTLEPAKRLGYIKENETYGDMIFIDAPEGAGVLTNKTLSLFIWAYQHVRYKYLMKCDDDTYVFITPLLDELKKRRTIKKFYYGKIAPTSNLTKPGYDDGKWADDDWGRGPYYIPFALGGGYILSYDLVALLSEQSPQLKWHIKEDTAVGAWLSAFDIERRNDDRFCYWLKGWYVIGCKCYKSHCSKWPVLVFMFHNHNPRDLKEHFTRFHKQVSSNTVITIPLTKERFVFV